MKPNRENHLIISVLLLVSLLFFVKNNQILSFIGFFATISINIIYLLKSGNYKFKMSPLSWSIIFFTIYNIYIMVIGFSSKAIYSVVQQVVLLLFMLILSNNKNKNDLFVKYSTFFTKIYYIILIIILAIFFSGNQNQFLSIYSGTFYKSVFAMSFFAFVNTNKKIRFVIFSALTFFIVGERTSAILFLLIYMLEKVISSIKSKKIYNMFFIVYAVIIVSIPQIYVWVKYQPIGEILNAYSRELSGENFFSGRNNLWELVYYNLNENEIFGLTYNNNVFVSNNIELSTHNLYLWLQINGGYIALALFVMILYFIWNRLYSFQKNRVLISAAAYLMGFMLLVDFELLWLTNNFVVSLYMWFVLGVSLSYDENLSGNDYMKNEFDTKN